MRSVILMKNVKGFIIGFIAGAIIFATTPVLAQTFYPKADGAIIRNDIKIVANDKNISLQKSPISYNGSTYVFVRDLEKTFDKKITWDSDTSTILIAEKELPTKGENLEVHISEYQMIESKYGFDTVYVVDGEEYVDVRSAQFKLNGVILVPNLVSLTMDIVDQDENVLIGNVPIIKIKSFLGIKYSYFTSSILPLSN